MSTSSTRPNADGTDTTATPAGHPAPTGRTEQVNQVDQAERVDQAELVATPADQAEQPESTGPTGPAVPERMVFQIPRTALLAIAFVAFCASPVALGAPGLQLIYLIPIALVVWVIRTRTVVTAEKLVLRTLFGQRELAWSDVRSLRLAERGWVRAVLADDTELPLHGVRPRHLFLLSAITAGRIADPTAPAAPASATRADDEDAADAPTAQSGHASAES